MAKAPRRRGRDDRSGKKPPAARPVRPVKPGTPPAAKPVKPGTPPVARPVAPVAKPVKPGTPPAAKPVAPPAKPVAPVAKPVAPVAKPVAPVAKPVAPVAQPAAAPAKAQPAGGGKRGSARRMAEEEVGRPRTARGGRGGYSRGGMGIGAKVGLLAALVTFLCVGATVALSGGVGGGGDEEADKAFNSFGYAAASILTAPDAHWYRGKASGESTQGLGYLERTFKDLLGSRGEEFWDARIAELSQPPPRDMNPFEAEKLKKDQTRFQKAVEKLSGPVVAGPTGAKHVFARLSQVWNAMRNTSTSTYKIQNGWITEVGKGDAMGKWLAGTRIGPSAVKTSSAGWNDAGSGYAWIDGMVEGQEVRIFRGPIRALKADDRLEAYISVFRPTDGGGAGGLGLGMIMLILGPLLVGFVANAVAGSHTKSIRNLAREIDRLGSSGDPTRELRAGGAEASAVARSVERMVSNLEFRAKHEGADLDEVVSREQQVAQEIHGTLMSKNPPRLSNYEVETLFKPGFEIGGDHFEYFQIDDDHLGIILLDTNVRGIPAALVMSAAKSYLRAAAPGVLSPAAVLKQVNRNLAGELPPGRHVTALYAVLNQTDGSATLASAGHLPLLVYRHATGKMAKVNPEGIALGLDAGPVFERSLEEGDIPIGVGDRIVLYTDGALKIQNSEGDEFGEQRFYAAVTSEAPKNSQAFVNFVGAAIDRFHLELPQNDDITISTVKRLR